MERYDNAFAELKSRQEGAFVPFVTLGDPGPEQSLKIIDALIEAGADALELGIPFSDPLADGPTIQNATLRAFAAGVTPTQCFEMLAAIRQKHPTIPIGLLMYANLVFNRGIDEFYAECARVGVDSVLVADVPQKSLRRSVRRRCAITWHLSSSARQTPMMNCCARLPPMVAGIPTCSPVQVYAARRTKRRCLCIIWSKSWPSTMPRLRCRALGFHLPTRSRWRLTLTQPQAISGSAIVKIIEKNVDKPEQMLAELKTFVSAMKAATRKA